MIPYKGREIGLYNEKVVLRVIISEYEMDKESEIFLFDVKKVLKDELKKYECGIKIRDKRKVGEECLESGFFIDFDTI